jgi:hypothetical protein
MISPGTSLENLAEADLLHLVEAAVPERRTIEYKRELPSGGDEAKREFLADVSSFANANGGDLIFGIPAQDGVPTSLEPLTINPDSERLRWEQAIRDGITPRIVGVHVREIPVSGGHVLVIRIPKTWQGPHAVTFKGAFRFYSRTSAGKYPLDVGELRSAFLAGTSLADQIRAFRAQRISVITAGEAPITLPESPKLVLHLFPYESFAGEPAVDINLQAGSGLFRPLFQNHGGTERWNIDGLLTYELDAGPPDWRTGEQPIAAYSQLFRNGIFEGVNAETLSPEPGFDDRLHGYWFEQAINTGTANPIEVLRRIGVQPPVAILISVIGARGYHVLKGDPLADRRSEERRIDRDLLLLPDVVLDHYPSDYRHELSRLLRPIVDAFWQSGGWSRSTGYNAEGDWIEK